MEIARDVEEVIAIPRQDRGGTSKGTQSSEKYQEGLGLYPKQKHTEGQGLGKTLLVT